MSELQLYDILKSRLEAIITANNNIVNNCPYIKKDYLKTLYYDSKNKKQISKPDTNMGD